jgi:ABC-type thiamine transport system ATPase subunit
MSPTKMDAKGIGGCVLAEGRSPYLLKDGTQTYRVALTRSLLRAEPCLRRLIDEPSISHEEARALGYRVVYSYDDAVMHGLV